MPADTVQFAVSFRNLQDPIDKIVLSGNGVDRTLTVIDSQAQLQDYLVDKGATEAVVKGYNGEQLRWQRPIALPQVMEVESIVPDYTTPLYDSYVVSLRINYNAITKIDDFTDINAGTFLHFRTTDDELVEYVPIEFNPDATTAVCTFKIFTDDQVTRGKLQTDTAAYLEIELK